MYVETRTTVQQVLDDITREVQYLANRVTSEAVTHHHHPTYITKATARASLHGLMGARELAERVCGALPDELTEYIAAAVKAYEMEWGLSR